MSNDSVDEAVQGGAILRSLEGAWQAATGEREFGPHYRLGETLVQQGMANPALIEHALSQQSKEPYRPLGQILLGNGDLVEADLQIALATMAGMPVVDCLALTPEDSALQLVPLTTAERERVLPLARRGGTLLAAMADPWRRGTLDELGFLTNLHVVPVMALPGTLGQATLDAYKGLEGRLRQKNSADVHELAASLEGELPTARQSDASSAEVITESSSTLVRLVNTLIEDAIKRNASDIHIEATSAHSEVVIRFRVDGVLVPYLELPSHYRAALVARLKIMSDLDIAERRKPQDGKIDFSRFGDHAVELRIVTVPTTHGVEDVVLRLLAGSKPLPIDAIGLSERNLKSLTQVIAKPYGLILICGPTGCGKTTTLHSVLRELNQGDRKIWTAEDPIEITQPGLCQVQVNPRIGWTFAAAMRTFLRADPDVIMIGEMRDQETADIAVEASLTGHLVFSTLHTNSAPESIARLLEIGLDPFNFSDSLLAVLAQRLVRRICPTCGVEAEATEAELDSMLHEYLVSARDNSAHGRDMVLTAWRRQHGDAQGRIMLRHRGPGCPHCNQRGYKGRMGIHELLIADDTIRQQIRRRSAAAEILATSLSAGMRTLRQDGIDKVLQGHTDLKEVLAASNS
ncbi:MAG TPA: GspE/PulE family protein [Aquabacterium sp.]|nr:GspE/PulE family protein [Aquabacterium sp.]